MHRIREGVLLGILGFLLSGCGGGRSDDNAAAQHAAYARQLQIERARSMELQKTAANAQATSGAQSRAIIMLGCSLASVIGIALFAGSGECK